MFTGVGQRASPGQGMNRASILVEFSFLVTLRVENRQSDTLVRDRTACDEGMLCFLQTECEAFPSRP